MQLNFNFDGKTLLPKWWPIVKDNFTAIQNAFNEHTNKFTKHKTAPELDHPDKSVASRHIADKAVGTEQIADYAVGQTQLAQYSVSAAKIYPAAVQTPHIKDGNVTKEKLEKNLRDLLDQLQNYAPTYNLTFNDFDFGDVQFIIGEESNFDKVIDGDFVYYQDKIDQINSITERIIQYYFGGVGTASEKKDAYKTIQKLTIKADLGVKNGVSYENSIDIDLYRLTGIASPEDGDFGTPIPASDYQIIQNSLGVREIVFLTPITLAELSVNIQMTCSWTNPDNDEAVMSSHPRFGFLAEVKVSDGIDTELSDDSTNAVENRVVKAGIDTARQAAVQEVKDELYGSPKHTYTVVLSNTDPVIESLGAGEHTISLNLDEAKVYRDDAVMISQWDNYYIRPLNVIIGDGGYLTLTYNNDDDSAKLTVRDTPISYAGTDGFSISLFYFHINEGADDTVERLADNADTTGATYTVIADYTAPQRTLDNLKTKTKKSFLDAVNENADKISATEAKVNKLAENMMILADAVTGKKYQLTISNGEVILKEITGGVS